MSEWISVNTHNPALGRRVPVAYITPDGGRMLGLGVIRQPSGDRCGSWHVLPPDSLGCTVTHWLDNPALPPAPKLTAKEALREAVTALEHMFPFFDGYFTQSPSVTHRYGELMPRLRAALESEGA